MNELHKIAHPRQLAFLSVYTQVGIISVASRETGVARRTHYHWLATDSDYRDAFKAVRENVCLQIEDGLVDRLIHGWTEPVFYKGEQVGERRKYDNAASIAYLDRHSQDWRNAKTAMEASSSIQSSEPPEININFVDKSGPKNASDPKCAPRSLCFVDDKDAERAP